MKIKHLTIISTIFIILSLAISIAAGFTLVQLPELAEKTVKSYKFARGIKIFCDFIPPIVGTAFLLGFSFDFGKNYQGSLSRFSPAMFVRFKTVLVTGLIFSLLLTLFSEVVFPLVNRKIKKYEEMPKLQKEYKNFAANLYSNGRFELSREFAKMALEIDPMDSEAVKLMDEAEIAAKQMELTHVNPANLDMEKILSTTPENQPEMQKDFSQNKFSEPYKAFLLAKECFRNEDWFGAHFYAQEALSISNTKDVNYTNFKQLAAEAWNKMSDARFSGTTEEQKIFAKKYEGYVALAEHDNLHAYYVFKTLSETSKKLSLDPDVVRYLAVAEDRLEKQYFFTDETLNLQNFEDSNNVYFKIEHSDKTTDIYFIKGITSTGNKANLIQYLRGLCVFSLDRDGNYIAGSYTAYAKMKEISTNYFDSATKKVLEIDEKIYTVPYIILNSVDKFKEGTVNSSQLKKGSSQFTQHGYIILPIKYEDFNILKEASAGIDAMSLSSLFQFIKIAENYGYSTEVCIQSVLNRLFYPYFLLLCAIALGIGAWHGRLPPNSIFKFKWIIIFPIFLVIDYGLYRFLMVFFKLMNYSILGIAGVSYALLACGIFYTAIFTIISITFVSCRNSMTMEVK